MVRGEVEEPTRSQIQTIQSLYWEMRRRAITAEEIEALAPTKKRACMAIVRMNCILERWDAEYQEKLKTKGVTVDDALMMSAKARLRTMTEDEEREVWNEPA